MIWKSRFDYISLLNIIDATVQPFYLHNHDADKTTEVLRGIQSDKGSSTV